MDINFNYQTAVSIRFKSAIIKTVNKIFSNENKVADNLSIVFCTDDYLLNINMEYLQHDTYTDIISFNYASSSEPVNGELYISIDRIRENAKEFKSSVELERARVIFHGVLHFCGFKDKTAAQKTIMRTMEDKYLIFYQRSKG